MNYAIVRPDVGRNKKLQIPSDYKVIYLTKEDRYMNSKFNDHHWTYEYVYNQFLPMFAKDYNLNINDSDYTKVSKVYPDGDFSYHDYNEEILFTITELLNGKVKDYTINSLRQHIPHRNNYHTAFNLYHKSLHIVNHSNKNGRKLLLNCDSMSVPLIPLIMPHYESIIVLDNRYPDRKPLIDYRTLDWNEECIMLVDKRLRLNWQEINRL